MRRFLTLALGVGSLVGLFIVFMTNDDMKADIHLITIKQPYARVIRQEEVLSILVYTTESHTFLLDQACITSTRLLNETQSMAVSIDAFRSVSGSEVYEGNSYYPVWIDLRFDEVWIPGYVYSIKDALLEITYLNETVLTLEIGSLDLGFLRLENPTHIDLIRMHGVFDDTSEVMTGVSMMLENQSSFPITITGIETLSSSFGFSMEDVTTLSQQVGTFTAIDSILDSSYTLIGTWSSLCELQMANDIHLFLPLKYGDTDVLLTRFPIIITYKTLGETYQYTMDDFMFRSALVGLEVHRESLSEYIYHR